MIMIFNVFKSEEICIFALHFVLRNNEHKQFGKEIAALICQWMNS